MFRFHAILHPTDLSRRPDPAFALACDLASEHHASLTILHVVERAGYRRNLLRLLHELHGPESLPVTHLLEEGNPADVIVRVAEDTHSDLIVMGTHGRNGLSRFLIGSVAEKVVRNAPCLVLTAKGLPADSSRFSPAHQAVPS